MYNLKYGEMGCIFNVRWKKNSLIVIIIIIVNYNRKIISCGCLYRVYLRMELIIGRDW